jgi:succinate dehydrogenase / fumarate reductase cytochrome b subunit
MAGVVKPLLYAVGVLSCVYHLANGIWTMGITWGVWVSPAAQKRADRVCIAFGIALAFVGLSALGGAVRLANDEDHREAAVEVEQRMWDAKTASGEVDPEAGGHKRTHDDAHASAE